MVLFIRCSTAWNKIIGGVKDGVGERTCYPNVGFCPPCAFLLRIGHIFDNYSG